MQLKGNKKGDKKRNKETMKDLIEYYSHKPNLIFEIRLTILKCWFYIIDLINKTEDK
jgi:hypothetical protein